MTGKNAPAVDAIKRLAGEKTFLLGEQLAQADAISSLSVNGSNISALVSDPKNETIQYRVMLNKKRDAYDGGCNCPVSENFDFCAHCVAVALVSEEKLEAIEALKSGSDAEKIEACIAELDPNQAKKELLNLVLASRIQKSKWLNLAAMQQGNLQATSIKKMINQALPLKSVTQQTKIKEYFTQASTQLKAVIDLLPMLPAEHALFVADHGLMRYDTILNKIEDTHSYRIPLFKQLEQAYIDSFLRLPWDDNKKADFLLSLYDSEFLHIEFTDIALRFIAPDDTEFKELVNQRLIAEVKKVGLQTNQATKKLPPKTRAMVQSIAQFYDQKAMWEQAVSWYILIADNAQVCLTVVELCEQLKLLEYIPEFLKKAQQYTSSPKQKERIAFYYQKYELG